MMSQPAAHDRETDDNVKVIEEWEVENDGA
jgi:hypothetical protein